MRNAPTDLMTELGHGKDYRYAHNEPNAFAAGVQYFPNDMDDPQWYQPVARGLEIKISEKLSALRKMNTKEKLAK